MSKQRLSRRALLRATMVGAVGVIAAACQPKVVEVEKVVKETVEVEKVVEKEVQVEVEKEVTRVVEQQVAAPREKVVLHLGKSLNPGRETFVWAAQQYEEANPHVTVVVEDVPYAELFTKSQALAATGLLWDVFEGHNRTNSFLAWKGICLQLDDFVETHDIEFDDFFPSVIEDIRLGGDGKLYDLPTVVHPSGNAVVGFNMDLLNDAGVSLPEKAVEGDWTIMEWEEIIRKVGKPGDIWGVQITDVQYPHYLSALTRTWGLPEVGPGGGGSSEDSWVLSYDGRTLQIGDDFPRVKAAMEWYNALGIEGYRPTDVDLQQLAGVDLFTAGQMVSRSSVIRQPQVWAKSIGDKFEARYLPWPKGPDGCRGSCLSYNTLSAYSKTKYPEETFLLLGYLTGPEAAYYGFTSSELGAIPRRSAWFHEELWADPVMGEIFEFGAHWFEEGVDPFPMPYNIRAQEVQDSFSQHITPYWNGNETWQEMVNHLQPAVQKVIDQSRP